MKKAVVFDFGAVLIDWSVYHLYRKLLPNDQAITEFLEEIKFSEFNKKLDAGYPFARMHLELAQKYPHHTELIDAFFDRWMECTGEAIQPSVEILYEVKAAGHQVYGLSNWSTESFPWVRHRYTFLSDLDDYLLSGMVGISKPDEEIFRIFLTRIGRQAQDCIFVDDSPANITAAERLGFTGILFQSPESLAATFKEMGILK